MPDTVLTLRSIVKRFGTVTAVDHVELTISRGEFFTLLGPSGSGKTTLLRIIAGLEWPDQGQVAIGGIDVTRLPPYARHIGMVFQNFLLFPHKTAAENIIFPLRMQRVSRAQRGERLRWAMKLMRLEGLEDRYPNEMSGGQQQRVALARGLISRPALLLLDEPLANLDRELRSEMEVEIRRYQKELEIPFVYVTHNQEEALTMSDRIAVMRNGGFEQVGAKVEIYTNPATAFVAGFVGHSNRFEARLVELAGDVARIDWKGTSMLVPKPRDAVPGAAIQYAIKYEDLQVAHGINGFDPTNRNWLSGRLRDVIFKGQIANYIVALEDGSDIVVSGAPHAVDLKPSDPVVVHWPITRGSCFRL
ncbi:MAG: ABC transporter ATP-binding protein [Rhodospirillales bacterium]|nr:ABC transporter ATP-binding protein [Rhodospirillales bacterium]